MRRARQAAPGRVDAGAHSRCCYDLPVRRRAFHELSSTQLHVRPIWLVLVLIVVSLGAFFLLPANDFVNFDDDHFIVENPLIRDLDSTHLKRFFTAQLYTPNYKPLVYLSWAIEYRFFGLNPRAFHFGNFVLHLINVLLVFYIFLVLGRQRGSGEVSTAVSWLAGFGAALFALHPMKVESVAWATERKDVLFTMFFLLALVSHLWVCRTGRAGGLFTGPFFYVMALLSKGMAITLPATLFVIDLWFGRRFGRRLILEKSLYLVLLAGALWAYGALGPGDSALEISPGAAGPQQAVTLAGYRYFSFLGRLAIPVGLAPVQPIPDFLRSPGWLPVAYLGAWAALSSLVVGCWRRTRLPALALGFYSITILPALALPANPTVLAPDRYAYLPALGWIALIVGTIAWITRRGPRARRLVASACALWLTTLAVATHRQVAVWRDSETLWSHVLAQRGPMALAYSNRGVARRDRRDFVGALEDFERGLELEPSNPAVLNNYGGARLRVGDVEAARETLQRAVALQPENPVFLENLGSALSESGQLLAAIDVYDRSIAIAPQRPTSYLRRGITKRKAGMALEAIADLDTAVELDTAPSSEAFLQRAIALTNAGYYREARDDNSHVLALDPEHVQALNNRGYANFFLGELEAAVADYDRALSLDPKYARAHFNRGDALFALGRGQVACSAWRQAAALGLQTGPELPQRLEEFCPN